MAILRLCLALALASFPLLAGASGSYGRPPVDSVYDGVAQADPIYELGKAVFNGKLRDYGRIKFCVGDPGASAGDRVNRKTLKPFRGAVPGTLASQLHDCDSPEVGASELLARSDLVAMLHYLDVRYRLKLKR
ncbi:MAG: hypothetical protein AAF184_20250 [Pseudomonadota bacterium]